MIAEGLSIHILSDRGWHLRYPFHGEESLDARLHVSLLTDSPFRVIKKKTVFS